MLFSGGLVKTERLFEQKTRIKRIISLTSQIEAIANELESPRGIQLSDMPRAQNPFDKQTYLLSKKMDLQNELSRHIRIYKEENIILGEVINLISKMPESKNGQANSVYQDILRYVFLENCSIKETNKRLNSNKVDFEVKEESYLRNLYEWQRKALELFYKCQKI